MGLILVSLAPVIYLLDFYPEYIPDRIPACLFELPLPQKAIPIFNDKLKINAR